MSPSEEDLSDCDNLNEFDQIVAIEPTRVVIGHLPAPLKSLHYRLIALKGTPITFYPVLLPPCRRSQAPLSQ